jgi:carboxyl-terminal processing protease
MVTWRTGSNALLRHGACVRLCAFLLLAARLPAQSPARSTMPDSVRHYVSTAMAAFRAHSVHQADVDWRSLEDSVVARAAGAQIPASTWAALTWALRRVDAHSFLMPSEQMMKALTGGMAPSAARPAASRPLGKLLDGGIGYVIVPPHAGQNRPTYVDSLQSQIGALDSAVTCGWVVDLRENTGGNMWPMLAGI